ncbi:ABC transporter permease [Azospirillum halopraeferens]|uniref:ABC transporter permease n=1 Tax=Azospirillum halopraeferens TaxID=34010 RepID=UPI0004175B63|nr:ABC transporter permease [Azospirillum halopraeferens]
MLALAVHRLSAWLALLGSVGVLAALAVRLSPGGSPALALHDRPVHPTLAVDGADAPLWLQVLRQVAALLQGDLGRSVRYADTPVLALIAEALPVTLALVAGALLVAAATGMGAGVLAALHRGRAVDRVITLLMVACLAAPLPVAAALAIHIGAVSLGVLPPLGWGKPAHAIMPTLVLALPAIGHVGRWTRALLVDVLERPFICQARAKGLGPTAVIVRHAMPHAAGPLLTIFALLAGAFIGGSAVVEEIFAIPGLGRLAVEAMRARDHPLAVAVVLCGAVVYATAMLTADLLAAWIDPRRRSGIGTGTTP